MTMTNLIGVKSSCCGLLFLLFLSLGMDQKVNAQKKIEYNYISVKDNKDVVPLDLTDEINKKCNGSLKRQIGRVFLELRYPIEFSNEAEKLSNNLSNAIKKSQEMLFPLPAENVKFYFFQRDIIPSSYKMSEKVGDESFYLHLFIFKSKEEINFECSNKNRLCESIYKTLPHELAHIAIEGLLSTKNNRWFHEGLADYAGDEIYRQLSFGENKLKNIIPEISLHRSDIRKSLLTWGYSNGDSAQNEYFRYQAALQLVKLIVEHAKNNKIENPLQVLFSEAIKQRESTKKNVTGEGLIVLIKQYLRVHPEELGVLDDGRQKELVENAGLLLLQDKINAEEEYAALYSLAGIDRIPLSDRLLNYLLEKSYKENENLLFRSLAATALTNRREEDNFERVISAFLRENPATKDRSVKKIREYLQKISLHPVSSKN